MTGGCGICFSVGRDLSGSRANGGVSCDDHGRVDSVVASEWIGAEAAGVLRSAERLVWIRGALALVVVGLAGGCARGILGRASSLVGVGGSTAGVVSDGTASALGDGGGVLAWLAVVGAEGVGAETASVLRSAEGLVWVGGGLAGFVVGVAGGNAGGVLGSAEGVVGVGGELAVLSA